MTQPPPWGPDERDYGRPAGDQPTAQYPRIDPVTDGYMPTQQPQPIPPVPQPVPAPVPGYAPHPNYVPPTYPAPSAKHSNAAVWVVVAVLAVIVVGLVGYLWLWPQIVNDDATAAGPSTSTSTVVVPAVPGPAPAQGGAGPAPATGETIPSYSTRCASVFTSSTLSSSAVGSSATSCEFAEEVRASYLRQLVRGAVVSINAYSPVTGRSYTMTCSGNTVVTCTGGNDAVVYLY